MHGVVHAVEITNIQFVDRMLSYNEIRDVCVILGTRTRNVFTAVVYLQNERDDHEATVEEEESVEEMTEEVCINDMTSFVL